MTLGEFLSEQNILPIEFARIFHLSSSTAYRLISGERQPSLSLAFAVEHWSGERVRAESFLPVTARAVLDAYRDSAHDTAGHGRRVRMTLRRQAAA
jgi:hypothetical protein